MNDLAPAYLSTLATQVGALSAFLSGWTRSRSTGLTTSIAAGIGVVLVTSMVVGMG